MRLLSLLTCILLLQLTTCPARLMATLALPAIFGNNMVMQRDQPLPIWGRDRAGTTITVTLAGNSATTRTGANGQWMVEMPAMREKGPHRLQVVGTTKLEITGILVGEVWLCSGQSNMEWLVKKSRNAEHEIANANHPQIRHIKITHTATATAQDDVLSIGWQVCKPATVSDFTATGYFFGRHLQRELDVPIGLIGSNWGGTKIEPWTPPAGFRHVASLREIADNLKDYPKTKENGEVNHQSATALYNGMIHPLLPFAIRGVIWYQGESNLTDGMSYYDKMQALIHGWRRAWHNDSLPFYFVQLAPFRYKGDAKALPKLWEAQSMALAIPHTGMAVTIDIGDPTDIHPINKQDVGKRLALWALAKTYRRKNIVYSGPLYKSHQIVENRIHVSFLHVGGGLVSRDDKPLTHFEISGPDGKFVTATAKIESNQVVVHAASVKHPTAVRFAWDQEAEPNLSNQEGLPAPAFRTNIE